MPRTGRTAPPASFRLTNRSRSGKHPIVTSDDLPAASGSGAAIAAVGDVELCYELVGAPQGPVVVLVNGLGGQMVDWDDTFLVGLRQAGLATLRFDNRDAGLSTAADDRFGFDRQAIRSRDRSAVAYTLDDMADDVAGLLDHLGIDAAHLLGVSMGAMVAQLVAVRHPQRVRSLCSIMSTTGARGVGEATPAAAAVLTTPAPTEREANIEHQLANHRVIGSPGFPADEDRLRRRYGARYDRSFRPRGVARQLMAVLMGEDRTRALGGVAVPTLVVHGDADPLISPTGGRATASAVPGAELMLVAGMGHDMPLQVVPGIVTAVVRNAARADARVRPGGAAPGPAS